MFRMMLKLLVLQPPAIHDSFLAFGVPCDFPEFIGIIAFYKIEMVCKLHMFPMESCKFIFKTPGMEARMSRGVRAARVLTRPAPVEQSFAASRREQAHQRRALPGAAICKWILLILHVSQMVPVKQFRKVLRCFRWNDGQPSSAAVLGCGLRRRLAASGGRAPRRCLNPQPGRLRYRYRPLTAPIELPFHRKQRGTIHPFAVS